MVMCVFSQIIVSSLCSVVCPPRWVLFLLTPPRTLLGKMWLCYTTVLYRPLNAFVLLALTHLMQANGVDILEVLAASALLVSHDICGQGFAVFVGSLAPSAAGGDHSSAVQPIVMSACHVRGQRVFIYSFYGFAFVNSSRRSHSHYS